MLKTPCLATETLGIETLQIETLGTKKNGGRKSSAARLRIHDDAFTMTPSDGGFPERILRESLCSGFGEYVA